MCLFLFFILVNCAALVMALLCNDSHGPPGSGFVVIAMPTNQNVTLLQWCCITLLIMQSFV